MNRIPDVIVMKGHDCVIGSRSVLRTMLSAGVLAVLLACADTAAGATWVVDDGGADFTSIQAAVDAVSEGDMVVGAARVARAMHMVDHFGGAGSSWASDLVWYEI